MDVNYRKFIKSVSDSKFIPYGEKLPDPNKPVFIPNSPKPISTKGEYMFYKDYYYNRETGFEWQRRRHY